MSEVYSVDGAQLRGVRWASDVEGGATYRDRHGDETVMVVVGKVLSFELRFGTEDG